LLGGGATEAYEARFEPFCMAGMKFDVVGSIASVEVIAAGPSVRVRSFLRKAYGYGRWRKMKGIAPIRLPNGAMRRVELHWYEAHGIGQRDLKIKRYVDER
jgi:hypothetical protein